MLVGVRRRLLRCLARRRGASRVAPSARAALAAIQGRCRRPVLVVFLCVDGASDRHKLQAQQTAPKRNLAELYEQRVIKRSICDRALGA